MRLIANDISVDTIFNGYPMNFSFNGFLVDFQCVTCSSPFSSFPFPRFRFPLSRWFAATCPLFSWLVSGLFVVVCRFFAPLNGLSGLEIGLISKYAGLCNGRYLNARKWMIRSAARYSYCRSVPLFYFADFQCV